MRYTCAKCGWSGEVSTRPRCLACCRAASRKWRQEHREAAREHRRQWEKKFRAERPEEYRIRRRIKRSKLRQREANARRAMWLAGGDVTRQQLIAIFKRDHGRCIYCDKPVVPRYQPRSPRGFDHLTSRAKGGKH